MDEIIKQAKHLGEMIVESKEFKEYESAKAAVESGGLLEKAALFENAASIIDSKRFDENSKLFKDANELFIKYKYCKEITEFIETKKKLKLLLDSINKALAITTGMDGGLDAGCGGCTGCPKSR